MKLSTRTRYAMRALVEIARNYDGNPVRLKTVARHQELSLKYLEQLVSVLKAAGLVSSVRGPRGGYILAKPPEEIRLSEVFIALEGRVVTVDCLQGGKYCARASECATRRLWAEIQKAVFDILESKTLADLVEMAESEQVLHYQI